MRRTWMFAALTVLLACGVARANDAKEKSAEEKEATVHATDPAASPEKTEPSKSATPDYREELEQLRSTMQQQIDEQQKQLTALTEELRAVRAAGASAPAAGAALSLSSSSTPVPSQPAAMPASQPAVPADKPEEAPTSIHIKGITLTPGGYFAAETVWRSRALSADINTPFTSTPYPGNSLSKVSEFNGTGRQSRIAMLAEGKLDKAKLSGYYEMDFLSAGVTSNNRQSNSYTMRQRQFWGQASLSGWTVTGGQMWSMVTETKKGIINRQEAPPLVIDAAYNIGFSWARQYGFRVVKSAHNDKFSLGFSVEGPQTTFGGRGVPTGIFFFAAAGAGGGVYNSADTTGYSLNVMPDFIVKAAFDPGWGHYEIFGIGSRFRNRIYPCGALITPANPCPADGTTVNSAAGAYNSSTGAGGFGANMRMPVFKKYGDLGFHILGGDGVGRYGAAQVADVTARPNGTLVPIHNYMGLGTLEFHPTPKLDVYIYYGLEYAARTWYNTSVTVPAVKTSSVGYGSPFMNNTGCSTEVPPTATNAPGTGGTCNGDIRQIAEGSIGFWDRLYKGNRGTIQWGLQYSYFQKNGWSGNNNNNNDGVGPPVGPAVSIAPKATNNMLFTSFRYVLP